MYRTTRVDYQYRDAGNYKFSGEFHVSGILRLEMLEPYMFMNEWFIPEVVGVPSLVPEYRNDDDHLLHEFCEFESSHCNKVLCAAEELVERFKNGSKRDWFGGLSGRYFCYSIFAR